MAGSDDLVRRARPYFGTLVEIAVPPDQVELIEAGFTQIRHVHERMSYHDAGSDLDRIRKAKTGTIVIVDRETVQVLRVAAQLHRETRGLFDVTVGRQLVESRFLPKRRAFSPSHIVGVAADIEIVDDTHVRCHAPMLIDLGGIAKGHGVDLAVNALIKDGCRHGIVNAGGDLRIFGALPQSVWLTCANRTLAGPLHLADSAIATSANRHHRRQTGGTMRTPHIGHGGASVVADHAITIIAPTCIIADALTKVAIADPQMARGLLRKHEAAMLIPEQLKVAA